MKHFIISPLGGAPVVRAETSEGIMIEKKLKKVLV